MISYQWNRQSNFLKWLRKNEGTSDSLLTVFSEKTSTCDMRALLKTFPDLIHNNNEDRFTQHDKSASIPVWFVCFFKYLWHRIRIQSSVICEYAGHEPCAGAPVCDASPTSANECMNGQPVYCFFQAGGHDVSTLAQAELVHTSRSQGDSTTNKNWASRSVVKIQPEWQVTDDRACIHEAPPLPVSSSTLRPR